MFDFTQMFRQIVQNVSGEECRIRWNKETKEETERVLKVRENVRFIVQMATNGWEKDQKNLVEGQREASKRSWEEVMLQQQKNSIFISLYLYL